MARRSTVPAQQMENEYSEISRNHFPDDFVFGTGTSAYQHEGGAAKGGRGPSIWDEFTLKNPDRILDKSNGNVAADMYTNYKEDIKMMKRLGFDAYRFSISWSRILPSGRICDGINQKGIDFYKDIIKTLCDHDIEPYVTLFHWDLPLKLETDYHGFLSRSIVNDFRDFAELCFREFGHKVKHWITLNEPWTYCFRGYVECKFPPSNGSGSGADSTSASAPTKTLVSSSTSASVVKTGDHLVSYEFHKSIRYRWINIMESNLNFVTYGAVHDQNISIFKESVVQTKITSISSNKSMSNPAKDAYTAARNMLLAHAAAVHSYRTKFQEHQKGKIGITLVSHWFEPLNDTDNDKKAQKRKLDFMLGWFLEPVLSGHYPQNMLDFVPHENLEPFSKGESKLLKGSIDFLGLNYYTTYYATDDSNHHVRKGYNDDQQAAMRAKKGKKLIGEKTDLSWLIIVPWGIYKLLKYINSTYNNRTYNLPAIYITENGVDEKDDPKLTISQACRDQIRVHYHRDHLENILKAMKEGVKVRGYFVWSWCDNFEWVDGYTFRFGIVYVDYKNHCKRQLKDSAKWFSKFLVRKKILGHQLKHGTKNKA